MSHDPYQMLENPFRLDGYVVVITGGAGAIGSAAGRLFAHQGADVVISDLNGDGACRVADEIANATGRKTLGMKTDATDERDLDALVDATISRFGKVTSLLNNVGWGEYTPLWDISTDYMLKSYVLNCVGTYQLTRRFMPHLEKSEHASVLMSGSLVGSTPTPEFLSYSNAKAALHRMTHSMAVVSGPKVRFNTVVIGSVDNGASSEKAGLTKEMQQRLAAGFVMKRRGTPWDVAYMMNYVISPAAAWVTNQEFIVDGGGGYKSKMPTQE
ncbi:MAG TPA: SDR family oxidoreductase [Gemmatimonadales bacterium]|nr:SDR family oxidoreductase [Gemmatimonadales bacterium]